MSKDKIDGYFEKYGRYYDSQTIKYTKNLARNINTSTILKNFLTENNISILSFLNEIAFISDFKLKNYGDEKLAMNEIQEVLNFIVFSNEIEEQIMLDNVTISSIGEDGILFYKANYNAIQFFIDKYDIDLGDDEFDFSIINKDIEEEEESDKKDDKKDDEEIDDNGFNVRLN